MGSTRLADELNQGLPSSLASPTTQVTQTMSALQDGLRRRANAAGSGQDATQASGDSRPSDATALGSKPGGPATFLGSLDGLRAAAALFIAAFHGVCWAVMLLRNQESRRMLGAWGGASLYIVVDLFLALTGFLAALPLLKPKSSSSRSAASRPKETSFLSCLECCGLRFAPLRRKFWRIMPPYMVALAMGAIAFHDNKQWPRSYTKSEGLQRLSELFGPGNDWMEASLPTAMSNLLHLNSIIPYGGFFIHTWSLGVQYLFWVTFPTIWHVLGLGKGARLPALALLMTVAHGAFRIACWAKLRTFGGPTDASGFLHFSFYVSVGARCLPMVYGALVVWVLYRAPDLVRSLRGNSAFGWTCRICGIIFTVMGLTGNALWESNFGHPEEHGGLHQALFYLLSKPGGTLCAAALAWWILAAVADIPILLPVSDEAPAAPRTKEGSVHDSPSSSAAAAPESWLTSFMSRDAWKPISAASYWLYLIHPIVYTIGMSAPHFTMPPSELRLPAPHGYGLAIPKEATTFEGMDHPLSAASMPTVAAVTNASAPMGWVPWEVDHWLARVASERGLEAKPHLDIVELSVGGWLAIALGVWLSFLAAYGLTNCLEPWATRQLRSIWGACGCVGRVLDGAVDVYSLAMFISLPALHVAVNGLWFFAVWPEDEGAIVTRFAAEAQGRANEARPLRAQEELTWRGPRVAAMLS